MLVEYSRLELDILMEDILELVTAIVAASIYGTEDKPRHPFWRNSVRTIAFAGAFVSAASLLNMLGGFEVPLFITLIWAFCSLIVITAEYDAGSKKVGVAAFVTAAVWSIVVVVTSFIL